MIEARSERSSMEKVEAEVAVEPGNDRAKLIPPRPSLLLSPGGGGELPSSSLVGKGEHRPSSARAAISQGDVCWGSSRGTAKTWKEDHLLGLAGKASG
jgi:hypothetical protein